MLEILSIGEVLSPHQVKALHYRSKLRTCIACYVRYLEALDIDELSVINGGATYKWGDAAASLGLLNFADDDTVIMLFEPPDILTLHHLTKDFALLSNNSSFPHPINDTGLTFTLAHQFLAQLEITDLLFDILYLGFPITFVFFYFLINNCNNWIPSKVKWNEVVGNKTQFLKAI